MSAWYPSALNAVLRGDVRFEVDTFKAQMMGDPFAFDPADAVVGHVNGSPVGAPVNVSVISVTDGRVIVNDIVFLDVGGTTAITALVVFRDIGALNANPLICCIDRRADTVPINVEPNGGDLTFSLPYLVKM